MKTRREPMWGTFNDILTEEVWAEGLDGDFFSDVLGVHAQQKMGDTALVKPELRVQSPNPGWTATSKNIVGSTRETHQGWKVYNGLTR